MSGCINCFRVIVVLVSNSTVFFNKYNKIYYVAGKYDNVKKPKVAQCLS